MAARPSNLPIHQEAPGSQLFSMDNQVQAAAADIASPVPIAEPTDIPPGPLPQAFPEQGSFGAGSVQIHGPGFTLQDALGLFNIFVGVMIVMAIILFFGGVITWAVRLGTIYRHEGIRLMEWGVAVLFVVLVLLAIVKYLILHPHALTIVVSIAVGLFIAWVVFEVMRSGGAAKEEH